MDPDPVQNCLDLQTNIENISYSAYYAKGYTAQAKQWGGGYTNYAYFWYFNTS